MTNPLMPKATAVWLVENTTLTFNQIAEFCGLHPLEVQGIADGDVATGIMGVDPVAGGQLERANLEAAIKDEKVALVLRNAVAKYAQAPKTKGRYTPVAQRQDKPDAIAWILKNHPELTDGQIVKLVGTTKKTIEAIRDKTFWNTQNIRPRDPVLLGLCTQTDLHTMLARAESNKAETKAKKKAS